jgi:hypothetical protein
MTCRNGDGHSCRRADSRLSTIERKELVVRSTCICIAVLVGALCCGLVGPGVVTAKEGTLLHESPILTPGFSVDAQLQLARNPHHEEKHHKKHYEPKEYDRSRRSDERRRARSVVCRSRDYQYNHCPLNRRGRDVRIVRQLSDTRCVRGDNWGANRRGVWVDRGCSGKFVVE